MKIELKDNNKPTIGPGCLIVTDYGDNFLVAENDLDMPCKCSENMGKGYVLIRLAHGKPVAWNVFAKIEDITEELNIVKIVMPNNLLLKEI